MIRIGTTITITNTTTRIEYFYDSYDPYGFSIDGTFYCYVKNLQGDVTQIRDENNNPETFTTPEKSLKFEV